MSSQSPCLIARGSKADDLCRTLAEYKRRFGLLLDSNDESGIPSDLRSSVYSQSVKHGGEKEYLKVRLFFLSTCSSLTSRVRADPRDLSKPSYSLAQEFCHGRAVRYSRSRTSQTIFSFLSFRRGKFSTLSRMNAC